MTAIYLDHAATTPVDPRVVEVLLRYLTREGLYANPASGHGLGRAAARAVERAREQVAGLLNADPRSIVFTSGATESNNLALLGAARASRRKRHIITARSEHKAVLDPCRVLEGEGFEVTYLSPDPDGRVPVERLESALTSETLLVSLMLVNNETGVVQDIPALGRLTRAHGVLFHVDAAQGAGKLPIDLADWPVDLLSLSAHKFYGPKGIGALYVGRRPRVPLIPQLHGGGHERGLRSGTLPVHQIAALGAACELAAGELPGESRHLEMLRARLWQGLTQLPGVVFNGNPDLRVPGILNLSFIGIHQAALLAELEDQLLLSSGSACSAFDPAPSHVLTAMGRDASTARAALRFSPGRFTTGQEIDRAVVRVREAVARLRALSPVRVA